MSRISGDPSEPGLQPTEWPSTNGGGPSSRALRMSGVFLGLGLGGFVDGILFHQILQWHHMLSNFHSPKTIAGLELNTAADGLFHASTWLFVVLGLLLLWRAVWSGARGEAPSGLAGWILVGWGGFNLVEGIVDHHLLQIHHVKPGPDQVFWDLGFLSLGALLLWLGLALADSAERGRVEP